MPHKAAWQKRRSADTASQCEMRVLLRLACVQDRALAAVVLIAAHFGAWSFADDILLREIAGGPTLMPLLHMFACGIVRSAPVMKASQSSQSSAARIACSMTLIHDTTVTSQGASHKLHSQYLLPLLAGSHPYLTGLGIFGGKCHNLLAQLPCRAGKCSLVQYLPARSGLTDKACQGGLRL